MPEKIKKTSAKKKAIDAEQRMVIAWRIQDERKRKFPGFGGGKECCEAIGVSPAQWSHWEHGNRTPNERWLKTIADAFGVPVEHLKTAPGNWGKIYQELRQVSQIKQKHSALEEHADDDDESQVAETPPSSKQIAPAQREAPTGRKVTTGGPPKDADPIKSIIAQILKADEMHDRGEISTPLFDFAMETIGEHLEKLFSKRNFL